MLQLDRSTTAGETEIESEPLLSNYQPEGDDPKFDSGKATLPDPLEAGLKKSVKSIMWIKVKKETTGWNLVSLFMAPLISVAAGAYTNAQMPYLLRDADYFDIPFNQTGRAAGQVLFYAYLISTIVTPFLGYVYDLVGRFWFMIPACFALTFFLSIVPFSSPHFWILCSVRAVMSIIINVVHVSPLLVDYVKSESRGLAMALGAMGLVLGELVMVGMFSITRKMDMQAQFYVPAIILAAIASSLIFLVREPKLKQLKEYKQRQASSEHDSDATDENGNELEGWAKVKYLTKQVMDECTRKPKYVFCFICLLVSRLVSVLFSVYMQLWILSFEQSGLLASKGEADAVYMRVVVGAQIAVALTIPLFGFLADKADVRVLIPSTFLVRGLIALSFRFITDPRDFHSYVLSILMVVVSIIQFISVEVIFMRNMKGHIRGTLSGMAFFFGSFGTTTFSLVGGIVFDKIGPWAPFMVVGGADMLVLAVSLIFILKGAIGRND